MDREVFPIVFDQASSIRQRDEAIPTFGQELLEVRKVS